MLWLVLGCNTNPVDSGINPVPDDTLRAELQLQIPLSEPEYFEQIIGVDHDPVAYSDFETWNCIDYAGRGFPHCYDGHRGTDIILIGGFDAMAEYSPDIVAAAAGIVVSTEDGNYDQCHFDASEGGNFCDGYPMIANAVTIEHSGGYRTLYWHMKKDSVSVTVGQEVQAGDVLGQVGSSGNSAVPHLHFGLESPVELVIDPYAGEYSQPQTWWCEQGDQDGLPGFCPE